MPEIPSMMMMYGVAVMHALKSKGSSLEDLQALRQQVQGIVAQQGDLTQALGELDREIASRGAAKSGPPGQAALSGQPAPSGQAASHDRFVVDIAGLPLDAGGRERLESRLRDLFLEELAGLDTGGDLVVTPLSELKFGPGLGGATAGMFISGANLRL